MSTTKLDALKAQVELLRWCKARRKEIGDVEATARAAVEKALEDAGADTGTVDGNLAITWRAFKRRVLNQKALKADHPDIVENYTEATEVRRFEVFE